MKFGRILGGMTLVAVSLGFAASNPNLTGGTAQTVVTVLPGQGGNRPDNLQAGELTVMQGKIPARVTNLQKMARDLSDLQLFILLDDSTRSSSLGVQLGELKTALKSLPPTTQVGIGYMRNGAVAMAQAFTTDHEKAASSLRLPMAGPGENGSPYFVLTDLAKHWPSKEPSARRAVLMLTDGVDRYFTTPTMDDPYVEESIQNALKQGLTVYSIYLRGAGLYGRSGWVTNFAQSRLIEVSEQTGGYTYYEGLSDPVTIAPFLKDFVDRLQNQYQVTIQAAGEKGVQPVKVRTEMPGVKIDAPTRIYVR